MKIIDITEGLSTDYKKEQDLNHSQYRKLVTRMKRSGSGGNKLAKKALRDLLKQWRRGDKAIGNYKKIFDDAKVPF